MDGFALIGPGWPQTSSGASEPQNSSSAPEPRPYRDSPAVVARKAAWAVEDADALLAAAAARGITGSWASGSAGSFHTFAQLAECERILEQHRARGSRESRAQKGPG